MESPACAGCRERDRLIADLRRRTSQLEAQVERLTRLRRKLRRHMPSQYRRVEPQS